MIVLETIAVLFSLICVWLAIQKNVLNWPIGIIAVSAYCILFYLVKLYADMALQIIFLIQGFYGWYNWKNQKDDNTAFIVSTLSLKYWVIYITSILLVTVLWASILKNYTDASLPIVDAFAAILSLTANWLMAKKYLENWFFWILADCIYIVLFWYKELYLSSGIYVLFLILAIKGFSDWRKINHTKKVLS
jgi:nicotinamide mononucleotide transporter